MKYLSVIVVVFFVITFINSCKKEGDNANFIKDTDGNVYKTVIIGTQIWMAENLKTTRYRDSTTLQRLNIDRYNGNRASYGWCSNDSVNNKDLYGALYSWYAIETGNLCPTGWHVPTEDEWLELIDHLEGDSLAGGKLKEAGTLHWITPNNNADNSSGFTALPGGFHTGWFLVILNPDDYKHIWREDPGYFFGFGSDGAWWSSTKSVADKAIGFKLSSFSGEIKRDSYIKRSSFSVRCIKDN